VVRQFDRRLAVGRWLFFLVGQLACQRDTMLWYPRAELGIMDHVGLEIVTIGTAELGARQAVRAVNELVCS